MWWRSSWPLKNFNALYIKQCPFKWLFSYIHCNWGYWTFLPVKENCAIIINFQLQWLLLKLLHHKNTCKKPEAHFFYHGMDLEGKVHVCWIRLNKSIFYQQHEVKILWKITKYKKKNMYYCIHYLICF